MQQRNGSTKAKPGKSWVYGFMFFLCIVAAGTGSYFAFVYSRYSDFDGAAQNIDADAKAYRDQGWAWEAKEIVEGPEKPGEDGDPIFNEAIRQLRSIKPPTDTTAILGLVNAGKYQEADRFLKPLEPSLQLVRKACEMPSFDLGIDPDRFGNSGYPILANVQLFARLFCLRARTAAAGNRYEEALNDLESAWKLGVRSSRMPSTTAIMLSFSAEALVLGEVEYLAGLWIDRPDLRERLTKIIASPKDLPDLHRLYQIRAYEGLVSYRNFDHPMDALASSGEIPGGSVDPGIAGSHANQPVRTGLPTDSKSRGYTARHFQLWGEVYKAIKAHEADPIALAKALRVIADKWESRQTGSSMLAGIEGTSLPEFSTAIARIKAQALVTRAVMAAMDVRARIHKWPTAIAQIPGVWDDPFCHKPLHLKLNGNDLRIYSLGPDMTDDGGRRRSEIKKGGNETAYDIVASYPPFVQTHL